MAVAEFSWDASRKGSGLPGIRVSRSKLCDEVLIGNARWFIIFRWAVIAILLVFQIFALISPDALTQMGITHQQGWPVTVTVILCLSNIIYIYALDSRPRTKYNSPSINIWAQIIIDLLCLSIVIHYVGSIGTPAPFFYVLHIVLSCIFFTTIESLIVTVLVCGMYGVVVLFENPLLFLAPKYVLVDSGTSSASPLKVDILLWILTLNVLFVIVWYVVSRLAIVVRTNEQHLRDAYEQISQAQVEKDRYAVLMTHQLKAPLDAIRSKINLIKGDYCGEASPEIKDILGKIDNRASGMASLILDVLKLERLKAAARDADNLEYVSIDAAIRKCVDKLKPIANSRHIDITVSTEDFVVECIPNQLEVLFENLISNAIAYSYNGASVEIISAVDKQTSSGVVTVADHGIGIGDKDLPYIFDEYFYTPRAALHNRTSSGIGLSIVKAVAENNKLHIKVSSEQNKGTAFSVVFQDARSAPAAETNGQKLLVGPSGYLIDRRAADATPAGSTGSLGPRKGGCQLA
ncbi:MAG: HAMP domain-containing histidine kinase [Nitrosospira sp.]|nr:HAMP domain-containing histidine kinase [Nitrosospira sp.]